MRRGRRQFLQGAAAAGTFWLAGRERVGRAQTTARGTDSRIEVLLGERLGRIAPEIYGHFVEHLGGVVYDGIWVGEDSRVANVQRRAQGAGGAASPDQAIGDPLAGRLLCRPVRLARRHRPAWSAAPAARTSGLGPGVAEGREQGGAAGLRAEPFRDRGVRALLPAGGCAALHRGQPAQPDRPGLLAVGRVLQLPGGHDHPRRPARARRRARAAGRQVLGSGQRVVGLRRELQPRGVRGGVPAFRGLGPALQGRAACSSARGRTAATSTGRAASSRSGGDAGRSGAGRSIIIRGTRAGGAPPTGTRASPTRCASTTSSTTSC